MSDHSKIYFSNDSWLNVYLTNWGEEIGQDKQYNAMSDKFGD